MASQKLSTKCESAAYTNSEPNSINHLTLLPTPDFPTANPRLLLIDAFRGIAIVAMVIYHFFVDLMLFCSQQIPSIKTIPSWAWEMGSTFIGSTFLFLVGFSTWISTKHSKPELTLRKQFLKFGTVGAAALIVTIVSFVATPQIPILFGILHCIAVANLLICIFLSWRPISVFAFALSFFVLGFYFRHEPINPLLFSWIARAQYGKMGDYYPLIPWFGVALLGLATGKILPLRLYTSLQTSTLTKYRTIGGLAFLGRHSLGIYLVHQPILLLILYISGLLTSL